MPFFYAYDLGWFNQNILGHWTFDKVEFSSLHKKSFLFLCGKIYLENFNCLGDVKLNVLVRYSNFLTFTSFRENKLIGLRKNKFKYFLQISR